MSMTIEPSNAVAEILKAREQTVAVAESSTGGLISASLLAVPGASAYYLGGSVIYTMRARRELLGIDKATLNAQQPLTADYVVLCAETMRQRMRADWGLAELGAPSARDLRSRRGRASDLDQTHRNRAWRSRSQYGDFRRRGFRVISRST